MKYIVLCITLCCFIPGVECATAQSWMNVGVEGFSSGDVSSPRIACDVSGTPYVAYEDFSDSGRVTVKKFDGSSWVTVGAPGLPGSNATYWSFYISLAIDKYGTPYVFFKENADSGRGTVMKYDGTNWVVVGSRRFTGPGIYFPSIATDTSGAPYVAYQDSVSGYKAVAMKFNGSSWVSVGAPISADLAANTTIAIDKSNTPYVAYQDANASNKATVVEFNGTSWVAVGTPGFSAGTASWPTIAFDSAGTPYAAYNDGGATVMKYNGSAWVVVGSAGFSSGAVAYSTIAIDRSGVPYVSYEDVADSSKATVMKYNGSSWVTVGSVGFSPGFAGWVDMVLDGNGVPFVVFQDVTDSGKATVMRFDTVGTLFTNNIGISATMSISLFPNPARTELTITASAPITGVLIYNILGQPLYALKSNDNQVHVDVTDLPAGLYLTRINGTEVRKFVKQ
jgi:type IX secretion system substrate protein